MLIVGVDPGKTTGMCQFVNGEYENGAEIHSLSEVYRWLEIYEPEVIILEDFQGGIMRNSKDPLMVIGVVRAYAERHDRRLMIQSPVIQGIHTAGARRMHSSRHVRSAISHVLYYLGRQNASSA